MKSIHSNTQAKPYKVIEILHFSYFFFNITTENISSDIEDFLHEITTKHMNQFQQHSDRMKDMDRESKVGGKEKKMTYCCKTIECHLFNPKDISCSWIESEMFMN